MCRWQETWAAMMDHSFEPRQWFEEDRSPDPDDRGINPTPERPQMWVYRRTESNLWTVGFFMPSGEWVSESDHDTKEAAARRVRWLNGGNV